MCSARSIIFFPIERATSRERTCSSRALGISEIQRRAGRSLAQRPRCAYPKRPEELLFFLEEIFDPVFPRILFFAAGPSFEGRKRRHLRANVTGLPAGEHRQRLDLFFA